MFSRKKLPPDPRGRDLDETRRLAYMLLAGVDPRDRQLAGTLVNALVHHQRAATAPEALAKIAALLEDPADEDARVWLTAHVQRITGELGG